MNGPLFVDDIDIPGVLEGITIRSPVSKGRLLSIEAPKLPSSYYLIRAEDIPGKNELPDFPVPILAGDDLAYRGEPAALLIGPDKYQLEELAGQCRVIAEEEPPRFERHAVPPEAILAQRHIHRDEGCFQEAQTIVEGTYITGIQEHWYSEPSAALAVPLAVPVALPPVEPSEALRILTATQWPFQVRRSVAAVLDMAPSLIRVEPTRIGVHLDGKIWYPSLLACHAALGAKISGKPVRLSLSREEDFRYSPKRNGAEIHIRSALGDRGQLLASEISVVTDMGGRGVFTDEILDRTCLGALGVYKHGAIKVEGTAITTNMPPAGPLAGFGLAQGFFAAERHASRIADTLGRDPAEWRKNNLFSRNKLLAIGASIQDASALDGLLDTAAAMGDYYRKWAAYELLRNRLRENGEAEKGEARRGIGIAAAYQSGGFLYSGVDRGVYAVEITLEKDSSLEIKAAIVSSTNEYQQIWRNIAADILAVDGAAVRFVTEGTENTPDPGPACLSRNITVITRLVERACAAIRKQRFRDPLPITVRRACHPVKRENWEGKPSDQTAFAHPGWGAAVVETSIDPVSYTPLIRGVWLAVDGGKILCKQGAQRSLTLQAIHALSWAGREWLRYEDGRIPDTQIRGYGIPLSEDAFPIHIEFISNDAAGPKGIGELAFNCVPAAYVQAVSQAIDFSFSQIPITARDIWEAVTLKHKELKR
ncbi:MAG: molybdopterin-dependent oxidoreductase [Treponema sp.]|jgi:CO/xanthine dehydrogenase Mo-binding subunit|nr:molybdopterin-dependent oxidoreductase [Treponema sp.]